MSSRATASRTAHPRLHVDWTRCDGHGTCADLLPDLITRDDWGFPVLHGDGVVEPRAKERADLAVDVCPMLALKLISAPRR